MSTPDKLVARCEPEGPPLHGEQRFTVQTSRPTNIKELVQSGELPLPSGIERTWLPSDKTGTSWKFTQRPAEIESPQFPIPAEHVTDSLPSPDMRTEKLQQALGAMDVPQAVATVLEAPSKKKPRMIRYDGNGNLVVADGLGPIESCAECVMSNEFPPECLENQFTQHPADATDKAMEQLRETVEALPAAPQAPLDGPGGSKSVAERVEAARHRQQLRDERGASYGHYYDNHRQLGLAFTSLIEAHYRINLPHPIPAHVAALFMVHVKTVRAAFGSPRPEVRKDTYEDAANYVEIAEDCQLYEERHADSDDRVQQRVRENGSGKPPTAGA